MVKPSNVAIKIDRVAQVLKGLKELSETKVLVGIPSTKAMRQDEPITNAAIGYINEHGSPEANIPARPHMVPGIRSVKDQIVGMMLKAGRFALDGQASKVRATLNAVGSVASNAVKAKLTAGLTPPLAQSTIAGRMRRHKNRKDTNPKPLIDTGKYLRAITWVLRKR